MHRMFLNCIVHDTNWNFDTSSVEDMQYMFYKNYNWNHDISGYNITNVTSANGMLQDTAFSTTNYDLLLPAWDADGTSGVNFHAGTAEYSAGAPATARGLMVGRSWTITDGGPV
jgi:hypothetical protein